ncbi:MAG: Gfo/Idh/MocA family oxidoreductase [Chitinophagales bacterium]|nr:Gfo/Idh/MocA family oxidoreductase [Chitinophagales bacterium]
MKIGLVGVGHLGKIHLKCLLNTSFKLVGVFDPALASRTFVAEQYPDIRIFDTLESLIDAVDCVDIVSPTTYHYDIAMQAIQAGKHVFIEKPLTETTEQAGGLVQLAQQYGVKVQVGHVERYNPAIRSLSSVTFKPKFIEAHRLSVFNPRGTDVSVVLDLMIHDIDIILNMVKDEVVDVRANGVSIVSKKPDICNARIEFLGGAVANLTASRISMKNMRKVRIFQEDAYISLDFLDKEAQVIKIEDDHPGGDFAGMTIQTQDGVKRLMIESPEIMQNNAIEDELQDFYQAVHLNTPVTVTIEDGFKALQLAQIIEDKINGK